MLDSNAIPTPCGCSSMVEQQLPKRKANPRFQSLSCKPGAVWGQSGQGVGDRLQTVVTA